MALWCFGFAFHVLPGIFAGTYGVAIAVVLGAAIGATRVAIALPALVAAAAALTVIVAETTVSERIASRWARVDRLPDSTLGAAVALSVSLRPDSTVSSEALDHLLFAIELVRTGRAALVVTTTTSEDFPGRRPIASTIDQARLIDLAGERSRWLSTAQTRTTRDEALRTAELLMPRGVRTIAVVTSPMHTRRACAAFEAVGFHVTCIAARLRSPGGLPVQENPRDRIAAFGEWIYEVAAMVEYRARGWLR